MRLAIIQDLINAYEDHSRTDFDAHLKRLEGMLRYTGPVSLLRCAGSTPARSPSIGEDAARSQSDGEPGRECCLSRGGTTQGTA